MLSFSQRIGIKPTFKELQIESMDNDLRTGLWNVLKLAVLDELAHTRNEHHNLFKKLWINHFKYPIDGLSNDITAKNLSIKKDFFTAEWFEVYDLLEFIAKTRVGIRFNNNFIESSNEVLEIEFSAYRFINDVLAPISNETEISGLKDAFQNTCQFSALQGANSHLTEALQKLSDRKNPDYRNSIKESISAVEATTNIIAGSSKDTLGKALTKLKTKISLHPALESGFKQIYGYTSDADGIRHFLLEDSKCDFNDAKYMLVSCSAFINYLIVKAQKTGIQL